MATPSARVPINATARPFESRDRNVVARIAAVMPSESENRLPLIMISVCATENAPTYAADVRMVRTLSQVKKASVSRCVSIAK